MPTPRPHTRMARLVWTAPAKRLFVPRAEPTVTAHCLPTRVRATGFTLAATRAVDSGRHTVTRVCHHSVTQGDGGQDRA